MPHSTHCCLIHGCKYGDHDCPVVIGTEEQKYPCRTCGEMYEEYRKDQASPSPVCPSCHSYNIVFRDELKIKCLSCGHESPKEKLMKRKANFGSMSQ